MNGHYLHCAAATGTQTGLCAPLLLLAQVLHKAMQAPVARALKVLSQLNKLHESCPALHTIGHGTAYSDHIHPGNELPHKLRRQHIRCDAAQLSELIHKFSALIALLRFQAEGRVEIALFIHTADIRQLICREAVGRRAQHCN